MNTPYTWRDPIHNAAMIAIAPAHWKFGQRRSQNPGMTDM